MSMIFLALPLTIIVSTFSKVKGICASFRLHMEFKTLFMSNEEKHTIILSCHFNLLKPFMKGKRGIFDFDYHFAFLTIFL